jgi:hypothetical protein
MQYTKATSEILVKIKSLILLMNVQLKHFPNFEKYGLTQEIRVAMYGVFQLIIECEKKYQNKTSLSRLDVMHEQLRMLVNLAFELKYYEYNNGKQFYENTAIRRYTAASILINELGAMIGGWIRATKVT